MTARGEPTHPAPGVTVVLDTSGHTVARLRAPALTDVDHGRVAVLLTPGARQGRSQWAALDILKAIGVQHSDRRAATDEDGDWFVVHSQLLAHRIRDLIILNPRELTEAAMEQLLVLGYGTGTHLWLVTGRPWPEAHAELARTFMLTYWDITTFVDHLATMGIDPAVPSSTHRPDDSDSVVGSEATASTGVYRVAEGGEPLPGDQFVTFRAACRNVLSAEAFAQVDARLLEAFAWWTNHLDHHCEAPTEAWFAARIQDRFDSSADLNDLLIDVRAGQIAAFHRGLFLRADMERLRYSVLTTPSRAQRTDSTWARLRVFRAPHHAAACALAGAGVGTNDMPEITVDDTAADGSYVSHRGRRIEIEPAARPYVRAQRTFTTLCWPGKDAALLSTARVATVRGRGLANSINAAVRQTGVPVAGAHTSQRGEGADRWRQRWAVSVERLTPGNKEAPR